MREKIANLLLQYWQLLVFGVFLLGYITFSFYIHINGFSFITPDLIYITAIGLLVLILMTPTLLLFKSEDFVVYYIMGLSGIIIFFFDDVTIMTIVVMYMVAYQLNMTYKPITYNSDDINNETMNIPLMDKLFAFFGVVILIFIDFHYSLVILINMLYFSLLHQFYHKHKRINYMTGVFYLISLTYALALLMDAKGFVFANMQRNYITLSFENNESISGKLVFDSQDIYYVKDQNRSIAVPKNLVQKVIVYEPDESKNESAYSIWISPLINKTISTVKKHLTG